MKSRKWALAGVLACSSSALSQSPVTVVNSPSVTVENTPGVVLMNVPGVTVENDSESPVSVSIEESVENEPQALVEYRIVGYTVTRSPGLIEADSAVGQLVGYAAMHELCDQQVTGNARAAFSEEALRPAAPLFGQVGAAWLIPSSSMYSYDDAGEIAQTTCDWYTYEEPPSDEEAVFNTGIAFLPSSGRIQPVSCTTALPVACSAPVAVSVP